MSGIDIGAIAASGMAIAMDLAGSAKKTAIIHMTGAIIYDPATDTTTTTGADVPTQGIFYRERQVLATELATHNASFLVNGTDAPNGITTSDYLTIDGVKWNVFDSEPIAPRDVSPATSPATAANPIGYILKLRR